MLSTVEESREQEMSMRKKPQKPAQQFRDQEESPTKDFQFNSHCMQARWPGKQPLAAYGLQAVFHRPECAWEATAATVVAYCHLQSSRPLLLEKSLTSFDLTRSSMENDSLFPNT